MAEDSDLFEAYRNTDFCVNTPRGRIVIHVGHTTSAPDLLLREAGHTTWAYLTAFNPGSTPLSQSENEARQHDLEGAIRDLGHPHYHGEGVGRDRTWPAEPSLLVLGIDRQAAIGLGIRFGQLAIVCGELGRPATLVPCRL